MGINNVVSFLLSSFFFLLFSFFFLVLLVLALVLLVLVLVLVLVLLLFWFFPVLTVVEVEQTEARKVAWRDRHTAHPVSQP